MLHRVYTIFGDNAKNIKSWQAFFEILQITSHILRNAVKQKGWIIPLTIVPHLRWNIYMEVT